MNSYADKGISRGPWHAGARNAGARGARTSVNDRDRGMSILACFSPGRRALTNGEIAEMTSLTSSTVDERIETLLRYGYLEPTTFGAYRLAERLPKSLSLACS